MAGDEWALVDLFRETAAFATDGDGFFFDGECIDCDGMFRMTLSFKSTKDSFGSGEACWGCLPCARGDNGRIAFDGWLERSHADFAGEEGWVCLVTSDWP